MKIIPYEKAILTLPVSYLTLLNISDYYVCCCRAFKLVTIADFPPKNVFIMVAMETINAWSFKVN